MIFSNDPDFLQGWDDFGDNNFVPPANVINAQMWQDGYDAHAKYHHILEQDNDALYELSDMD